jgi:hypothetical protein
MKDINFNGDKSNSQFSPEIRKSFFLSRAIMRTGVIKEEKHADIISGALLVLVIIISVSVAWSNTRINSFSNPTPYSQMTEEQKSQIPAEVRKKLEYIELNRTQ